MQRQILVVEDDDDARGVLVEVLSEEYGPVVVSAENGKEALDLIRDGHVHPDVIILDLRMPVMDGVTFLKHRSNDPRLGAAPVIVLTAEPSLVPDLASTVAAVMPKPVPLARLLEIIHTITDDPSKQPLRTRSMCRSGGHDTRPPAGVERRRRFVG